MRSKYPDSTLSPRAFRYEYVTHNYSTNRVGVDAGSFALVLHSIFLLVLITDSSCATEKAKSTSNGQSNQGYYGDVPVL
jgi:hypothetical protein